MVTSQGIHLVFDRSFLKGDTALMVPRTSDGRVLFVIPWHGHAVAGTTDTPVDAPSLEPKALDEEIEFILETAGRYLSRPPTRADVLAVYVGLRPLVKSDGEGKTSSLSRDHVIHVDTSGLLTITGGKWTTYRHMAEDCVDHAITLGRLRDEECTTKNPCGFMDIWSRRVRAKMARIHSMCTVPMPRRFGCWRKMPELGEAVCIRSLPYIAAEVVWAARMEMARSVEDVLARRTRASLSECAGGGANGAASGATAGGESLDRDEAWIAAAD